MGDFQSFINAVRQSDFESVTNYLEPDFIDRIIDDYLQYRPFHLACKNGYFIIAKLLIDNNCDIECETISKYRPIHFACQHGHFDIAKLLIGNNCYFESETINKARAFHFACSNGHFDIAKLLIDNNCDIECETADKYRPLHFACLNGHLDIVELLIDNNCEIHHQNTLHQTALLIANQKGHQEIVKIIKKYMDKINNDKKIFYCIRINNNNYLFDKLYNCDIFDIRENKTNLSVLEVALQNKSDKIIKYILDKTINETDMTKIVNMMSNNLLLKEIVLYWSIKDHNSELFYQTCLPDIINGERLIVKLSFIEIAAQFGSCAFIDLILKRSIRDSLSWESAKKIAEEKGHSKIVKSICTRESLLEYRQKTNFSILHTAVSDNDDNMVQYLLDNNIVDANINNQNIGTSLALAHIMCYKNCISILHQYNVNTNTQNKYLQTPLHEAISSGMIEDCEHLINRSEDIDEKGFMGLSALHCAVLNGFEDLCEKLVDKGADCSLYVELPHQSAHDINGILQMETILSISRSENPLTLCLKKHETIYPCFTRFLNANTSSSKDGFGDSLLHMAVKLLDPSICQILIKAGTLIDERNNTGNTPLWELLLRNVGSKLEYDNIDKIMQILKSLAEAGANINTTSSNGKFLINCALKFGREKIMIDLLSKQKQITNIDKKDILFAFKKKWFDYLEMLIPLLVPEFFNSCVTMDLMTSSMKFCGVKLIKLCFLNANEYIQQIFIEDLLCKLTAIDDIDTFKQIVAIEIIHPNIFANGENLLTCLLHEYLTEFAFLLLRSVSKVQFRNMKNLELETPLEISIEIFALKVIEELVLELDNDELNMEDKYGNTPLILLFNKMSKNIEIEYELSKVAKAIICRGGDIKLLTTQNVKVINQCPQHLRNEFQKYFEREKQQQIKIISSYQNQNL